MDERTQLEILEPGLLTTVQDAGRYGYQASGFSVCGCMDLKAMHEANLLVNNFVGEAVLEMIYMGGSFRFSCDSFFALTGADLQSLLNDKEIPCSQAIRAKAGDVLRCRTARNGRYGYLAVNGGFLIPNALGSKSTHLKCQIGGFQGRKLEKGDILPLRVQTGRLLHFEQKKIPYRDYLSEVSIRVVPGPQYDCFTEEGKRTFGSEKYVVSGQSDRMGYRLEGPAVGICGKADMISDGIAQGSVQVSSDGLPMVLLADRQTTGGYAKIGTVIAVDLPRLVQCMPGSAVRFSWVTVGEAQALYRKAKREERYLMRRIGYCKENLSYFERIRRRGLWKTV
ncbi:MAG: biotin-dependent carboxyltransferase family protein [Lachnospiraceae bacterium]